MDTNELLMKLVVDVDDLKTRMTEATRLTQETAQHMADAFVLDKAKEVLGELGRDLSEVGHRAVEAADNVGHMRRELNAGGMSGPELEKAVSTARELGLQGNYSAEEIAGMIRKMHNLGAVTEERLRTAMNIAAGSGMGLQAVAQGYELITQGGDGASRALMAMARAAGITANALHNAGAEMRGGELFTGTPEAAERARQAFEKLALNKWPDAAKKMQSASQLLSKELEDLNADLGQAAAAQEAAASRFLAGIVHTLRDDLSPEVKAAIGVGLEMSSKLISWGSAGLQTAANIGILVQAVKVLQASQAASVAASSANVAAQSAETIGAGASAAASVADATAKQAEAVATAEEAAAAAANAVAQNTQAVATGEAAAASAAHAGILNTLGSKATQGLGSAASAVVRFGGTLAALANPVDLAVIAILAVGAATYGVIRHMENETAAAEANIRKYEELNAQLREHKELRDRIANGQPVSPEEGAPIIKALSQQREVLEKEIDAVRKKWDATTKEMMGYSPLREDGDLSAEEQAAVAVRQKKIDYINKEMTATHASMAVIRADREQKQKNEQDTQTALERTDSLYRRNQASIQDVIAAHAAHLKVLQATAAAIPASKTKERLEAEKKAAEEENALYAAQLESVRLVYGAEKDRYDLGKSGFADLATAGESYIQQLISQGAKEADINRAKVEIYQVQKQRLEALIEAQKQANAAALKLGLEQKTFHHDLVRERSQDEANAQARTRQQTLDDAKAAAAAKKAAGNETYDDEKRVADAEQEMAAKQRNVKLDAINADVAKTREATNVKVEEAQKALQEAQNAEAKIRAQRGANEEDIRKAQETRKQAERDLRQVQQDGSHAVAEAERKGTADRAEAQAEFTRTVNEQAAQRREAEIEAIRRVAEEELKLQQDLESRKSDYLKGALEAELKRNIQNDAAAESLQKSYLSIRFAALQDAAKREQVEAEKQASEMFSKLPNSKDREAAYLRDKQRAIDQERIQGEIKVVEEVMALWQSVADSASKSATVADLTRQLQALKAQLREGLGLPEITQRAAREADISQMRLDSYGRMVENVGNKAQDAAGKVDKLTSAMQSANKAANNSPLRSPVDAFGGKGIQGGSLPVFGLPNLGDDTGARTDRPDQFDIGGHAPAPGVNQGADNAPRGWGASERVQMKRPGVDAFGHPTVPMESRSPRTVPSSFAPSQQNQAPMNVKVTLQIGGQVEGVTDNTTMKQIAEKVAVEALKRAGVAQRNGLSENQIAAINAYYHNPRFG